jgi:protease I
MSKLDGKKVALLVTDGFEEVELTSPRKALDDAGATTHLVSPKDGKKVKAWATDDWGGTYDIDVALSAASAADYDALVLPGGVINPDQLRAQKPVREFVHAFFAAGKPVAAICHGPWTLIDAGVVDGRRVTSYHTLETDLRNAGATWVDEEVVVDQGLVTSRNPDDLPAFNAKLVEEVAEGVHQRQKLSA